MGFFDFFKKKVELNDLVSSYYENYKELKAGGLGSIRRHVDDETKNKLLKEQSVLFIFTVYEACEDADDDKSTKLSRKLIQKISKNRNEHDFSKMVEIIDKWDRSFKKSENFIKDISYDIFHRAFGERDDADKILTVITPLVKSMVSQIHTMKEVLNKYSIKEK